MLITIVVIFAVLVLLTRAAGLVGRRRLGVAGVETTGEQDAQPALVGAAMGVVALLLVSLLYVGITQWYWLGRPNAQGGAPAVITSAPVQSPLPVVGAGASPTSNPGGASPSPSK